ncbi:hypothetical protein K8353_41380, partial [Burkholderia contaminans]|nr:hypothetical protein [Burkholderia contaminans]
ISKRLEAIIEDLDFDGNRLMQVENRLDLLHTITRKYGGTVDDVLLYFAKITEEYNLLTGNNLSSEDMEAELKKLEVNLVNLHTEELVERYPDLTPKERENAICKEFGAVFLIGIGGELPDGKPHDGRAPDYDDWTSESENGYKGLNGDILVWNESLGGAFELSSMGIRVDEETLRRQVEIAG